MKKRKAGRRKKVQKVKKVARTGKVRTVNVTWQQVALVKALLKVVILLGVLNSRKK